MKTRVKLIAALMCVGLTVGPLEGCFTFEALNARVREKSTIDLLVLEHDKTPATDITVVTQESGWRHIVPIPWTTTWLAKHDPRPHKSDAKGRIRIDFGDDMLEIVSVSRGSKEILNYLVVAEYWWADETERKRPPTKDPNWHRGFNPKTQDLLGHRAEIIIGGQQPTELEK